MQPDKSPHSRRGRFLTWAASMLCIGLITAAIVGGPVNGLLKLRAFDVEQQSWRSALAERDASIARDRRDIEAGGVQIEELRNEIAAEQATLAELKEESTRLKSDRADLQAELAGLRKAEELLQQAVVAANAERDTAIKEKAAAEVASGQAEARTDALRSQETKLLALIETAQMGLDALKDDVTTQTVAVAKVIAEKETTEASATAAANAVDTARQSLAKLQEKIVAASAELNTAIEQQGKAVRDREAVLTEMLAEVAMHKKERDGLKLEVADLQVSKIAAEKALAEMVIDQDAIKQLKAERAKAEVDTSAAEVELESTKAHLGEFRSQLDTTQRTLSSSQKRLVELLTRVAAKSEELQTIVTEHGKALRDRETVLGEVRAANEQLQVVKQATESADASVDELRKTLARLQKEQIERAEELKTLELGIARLRKTLKDFSSAGAETSEDREPATEDGDIGAGEQSSSSPDKAKAKAEEPPTPTSEESEEGTESPKSSTEVSKSSPDTVPDGKDSP